MSQSRRDFIKTALAFTAAAALPLPKGKASPLPKCRCGNGFDTDGDGDCPACAGNGWEGQIKIRQVEMAYSPDGEHVRWHRTRFSALREGDIFRVIEPDGSIADQGTDFEVCWATGNSYPTPYRNGTWTWGVQTESCDLSPRPLSSKVREALRVKYNNLFVANPGFYADPEVTYGAV